MARYKFMTIDLAQAANRIENMDPLTDRNDVAEIVVLATSKRVGIYGTSGTVSASTSP